ncbi:uncharacterized protein LOC143026671 isoform X2 [Oratosquilla oratoria]|uniref:uncharacterized protein LOC143026671 isoform X2 n=1 Tax=Oratosquilla oratoria TaxID=337810 RepID=UPI003F762D62
MGCQLTKAMAGRKQKKKEVLVPDPPSPEPLDSRLPFTAKQKFNMVKSWKGIARAMEPTGVYMFLSFDSPLEGQRKQTCRESSTDLGKIPESTLQPPTSSRRERYKVIFCTRFVVPWT